MSFSPIDSILKVLTSCVHLMDKRFWLSRIGQSNSFSLFPTLFRSSHCLVYPFLSWVGTQISTSLSNLTPYSCHGFCDKVSECIFFGCGDNLDGDCRSSRKQRDRFGLRSLHTLLGSIAIKGEWIVSTLFSSPEVSGTPVYSFLQLRLQTIYRGKRYSLLLLFFFYRFSEPLPFNPSSFRPFLVLLNSWPCSRVELCMVNYSFLVIFLPP